MRARKFTKKIELWSTTSIPDGMGGFTSLDSQVGSSWANISTFKVPSGYQAADTKFGKNETGNALLITVRKRNDFDYMSMYNFIVYRGVKYSVSTQPTNVNFVDSVIQFVATKSVTLGSINKDIYPAYLARVTSGGGALESPQCTDNYINSLTG